VTDIARAVFARLDEIGIKYASAEHAPVLTIEDCLDIDRQLGSVTAKNYFLATKNLKHFYLCLVRPNARFRSGDVSKQVNSARLHFGPEDKLEELLKVRPGSVSPLGLMFDQDNQVQLLIDSALIAEEKISFHPCDNTRTLAMQTRDFLEVFLPAVHHKPMLVEIHDFIDSPRKID